ncbi:MAG: DoxX family membrane protein [Candidatus Paceibacterota bacterium]
MEILFLIGRIILGGFFIKNGIDHFGKFEKKVGYARVRNLPLPVLSVAASGVVLLLSGIGIVLGVYTSLAISAMIALLLLIAFLLHPFWRMSGSERVGEYHSFMNVMAIVGALLMVLYMSAGLYWPYVVNL